jgi:hypothetical protein
MRSLHCRAATALLLACGALAFTPTPASAQDYVTTTWTNLRQRPSMSGAKLRVLHPDDTLNKRSVPPRVGWLPVRTTDGLAGWVSEPKLRDLHRIVAATETTVSPAAPGAPAARIDPSWAKPPIDTQSMRVQGNTASCGPFGDATPDDGTNYHKNRADLPVTSHAVTVEAIRALPDTALWRFTNRKHWAAADSTLVVPYEGIAVTVEGYFEIVKAQSTSAPSGTKKVGEAPNCHSWTEEDTDWHMALVADPSEHEARAVVVEPTPRTKRHNVGWTPARAQALAVRRTPSSPRNEAGAARVRVTGFLMLDPVHPSHIRGQCAANCTGKSFYRATLWEVHPVTRIEVLRDGVWIDLNDLPQ